MPEFYVNCAYFEETLQPQVRVTEAYYKTEVSKSGIPVPVVKASLKGRSCYFQLRIADRFYLDRFYKYITLPDEFSLFKSTNKPGCMPIIFLPKIYRMMLGIDDISIDVKELKDLRKNLIDIDIKYPTNLFQFFSYLIMACFHYRELYSFLMFMISLIGLLSLFYTIADVFCMNPLCILSAFIVIFSLLAPINRRYFCDTLCLFILGIILILMSKFIPLPLVC